jgi:hypothetical protein
MLNRLILAAAFVLVMAAAAEAKKPPPTVAQCKAMGVDGPLSQPVRPEPVAPKSCTIGSVTVDGVTYPMPDPDCTPGAHNPSVTVAVLNTPGFTTKCVRNKAESGDAKAKAYTTYSVTKEGSGTSAGQICELDHLVPLEIGGGDTMDNIWPQCGPSSAALADRYFKQKDQVEAFLGVGVKTKKISQTKAQSEIARDWTQFLARAKRNCKGTACKWGD